MADEVTALLTAAHEAFELAPASAYAETCAAIASVFWNWRLLQATGEARFADLLERTLYNGVEEGALVPYALAERALRVWVPQKVNRQSVWAASSPSTARAPT